MRGTERLQRMVDYFRRRKEERAVALARIREERERADREVRQLRERRRELNALLARQRSGELQVELLSRTEGFKRFLEQEERCKREELGRILEREDRARALVDSALKEEKMWEKLKEKRLTAEEEARRIVAQEALDELSAHRKSFPQGSLEGKP